MKKLFIILFVLVQVNFIHAQPTVASITNKMTIDNNRVVNTSCTGNNGMIITNKALNYFIANKIASYLSAEGNISLFKSYATLNSSDGKLSFNNNIYVNYTSNGFLKSLTTIGASANISDGFAAIFNDTQFSNELGVIVKQTWFGTGKTLFDRCTQGQIPFAPSPLTQKDKMNAVRAKLIHSLEVEMQNKETDFLASLALIQAGEVPGQSLATVNNALKNDFYKKLEEEYLKKFDQLQADNFIENDHYNRVRTHWTTLYAYIPVTTQKFSVTQTFSTNFENKQLYPWEVSLSHNRIWETSNNGRFFFFISLGAFLNNAVETEDLEKLSLIDYKNLGGSDPLKMAQLKSEDAYVGNYSQFVTSSLKLQGVWFPKEWNVGISALLDQNFGKYNPLNGRLGIPIKFNDKDGNPTVNFEIQLRATDLYNDIEPEKSFIKKASIGISVGLPFSSINFND